MKKIAISVSFAIMLAVLAGTGFANAYTDSPAAAYNCEYEHHGHHGHGHGHDGCY